jgi:cobalt-zinc-cadmium efflux system outer membrane protein
MAAAATGECQPPHEEEDVPMPRRALALLGLALAGVLTSAAVPAASPAQPPVQLYLETSVVAPPPLGLPELLRLTAERHPRLAQVAFAVDAARGRAVQASLYPNPTLSVTGDEQGDRTGPGGIWTPSVSQEIVTAHKLSLGRAAALKEVDEATLTLVSERYRVFTDVRQSYFDVLTLQRRAEILRGLVRLAEQTVTNAERLVAAKESPRLDLVQLEVDLERYRADLESTERALPAAFRRLAASVGVNDLPPAPVAGSLEAALPDYDLERLRTYVLGVHPDVRSAQVGVERARLVLRRAQVEPIPNVTVRAGYTRQYENKSDDWDVGVSLPIPVWDRNQGNIHAAQARLGEAVQEVSRVQNDLVARLATAFASYAPARTRAERYRTAILPRAEEAHRLALQAYQGGQFEYLRVLQAQRAVVEANLEYVRALGEAWRSAAAIAGLTLEDDWPCPPGPPPTPHPNPAR